MKLYDDHFYCFGCQSSGDVITLVEKLFGLQPLDAAKKLQHDFGLAEVFYDYKKGESVYRERQKSIWKELEFKKWKAATYLLLLTDYCHLLCKWKEEYAPKKLLSGETMQNATEIGRYFYAHAKYAYDVMDSGNTLKMAEYVLPKLRQSGKSQTTRKELFRACRGSYFKQAAENKPIP